MSLPIINNIIITNITWHCSGACGIDLGDEFIVTGGIYWDQNNRGDKKAMNSVIKYYKSGLVESLPSLKQRRYGHACSSFNSVSGEKVGFIK